MFFSDILNTKYIKSIYCVMSASGWDRILAEETIRSMPDYLKAKLQNRVMSASFYSESTQANWSYNLDNESKNFRVAAKATNNSVIYELNLFPVSNLDLNNIDIEGIKLGSFKVECKEYINPRKPGILNLFRFNYYPEPNIRNINYEYTLYKKDSGYCVETVDTLSDNKFTTNFDIDLTLKEEEKEY